MPELQYCYNKGCGQQFDPANNTEESCLYHPGPPEFHDAYKIWKCCGKKSTDFGTWLGYKGCTKGKHDPEKKADTIRLTPQTTVRPEKEEEVIVWNGLNQPDERPMLPADHPRDYIKLRAEVSAGLQQAIKKNAEEEANRSTNELTVGTPCKNIGCKEASSFPLTTRLLSLQVYNGPESDKTMCTFHSGHEIFHEGMKYWSCCERKTSDFTAFLEQAGCTTGKHVWIKDEVVANPKEDWFQRSGHVVINLYCKNSLPSDCVLESDGLMLKAFITHGFGTKKSELQWHLFGRVDPNESRANFTERKIEIVLKQASTNSWPRLRYETVAHSESTTTA
ncbi:hypothetical protein M3Y99_01559600 [Aphelenchoides fujianensis]|nr:hypothetical protein M3Y99_01559600 [Aphelenchoides fujianensis]